MGLSIHAIYKPSWLPFRNVKKCISNAASSPYGWGLLWRTSRLKIIYDFILTRLTVCQLFSLILVRIASTLQRILTWHDLTLAQRGASWAWVCSDFAEPETATAEKKHRIAVPSSIWVKRFGGKLPTRRADPARGGISMAPAAARNRRGSVADDNVCV